MLALSENQERVMARVHELIERARGYYPEATIPTPQVIWYTKGAPGGWAAANGDYVRYHLGLLDNPENTEHYILDVVAHEIAHCVVAHVWDHYCKAHGTQWRTVMRMFGLEPSRLGPWKCVDCRKVVVKGKPCACHQETEA